MVKEEKEDKTTPLLSVDRSDLFYPLKKRWNAKVNWSSLIFVQEPYGIWRLGLIFLSSF